MSGFPTLQPAFTFKVTIGPPQIIGNLQVVPMIGGTVKSEASFSPAVDAEFVGTGNDYISTDADGGHLRLNAHGVMKTKDDALIYLNYTGVISLTDAENAVFSGTAKDGSTPFGNSFIHATFQTGDPRYKDLENRVFTGQGRFTVEKGKPIVVEYRVGQVVHG